VTQSRWTYFQIEELKCRGQDCCGGKADMDPDFMAKIVMLRRLLGFPFIVTSAYRCPEHNQRVSTTGPNGPHTTGRAIDLHVSHEQAFKLISMAPQYGITGIGVKQHGPIKGRFIHLDDLLPPKHAPRPHCWSYP
jgi:uncharacterized protein YcbK (DUF882 family)